MAVFGKKLESFTEQMLLNEAYVGRTPTLELIDQKIAELQEAGPLSIYQNMSRDKRIIELNRLFEKQFGMKLFSINIENSEYLNAWTYTISYRIDIAEKYSPQALSKLVKADSTRGYYYVPGNELCITTHMTTELLFNSGMTSSEIVAVMLHEIGHNFSSCLYGKLYLENREIMLSYKRAMIFMIVLGAILSPFLIGIPMLIAGIKNYRDSTTAGQKAKAERNEKNVGKTGGFFAFIKGLKNKYSDMQSYASELASRIADGWDKYKVLNPLKGEGKQKYKQISNSSGRLDEVFADKFAAVYGYGPELALGLAKMDDYLSKANKKIQLTGTKKEKANNLKFEEVIRKVSIYDVHPQTVQRAVEEIKLLKRELDKANIDPRLAEVIKQQVSELEEVLKKITIQNDELSKNDNARRAWNAYINKELPDAVNDKIEEEIEKALDSKLEEFAKEQAKKK